MRNTYISAPHERPQRPRGPSSVGGILVALMISAFIGGAIGLDPLTVFPLFLAGALAGVLLVGLRCSSWALAISYGWHRFVVLFLWIIVVNVPTFLAFDTSNFTHVHGLFNAQSLSRIAVFLITVVALTIFLSLWGSDSRLRGNSWAPRGSILLFSLYAWYLLTAPLVSDGTDLALSMFRAMEWIVAITLLCMATSLQRAFGLLSFSDRTRLLLPVLVFLVLSNVLLLPIAPSLVYRTSSVTGTARLGAFFTHPNLLGIVATLLCAHLLAFGKGGRKYVYVAVCIAVVALTYSRGGLLALALTLGAYLIFAGRSAKVWAVIACALMVATALILLVWPEFFDAFYRFLQRGNERQSLSDLSERMPIWEAARIQIEQSPLLGNGFIAGPKKLGDLMIARHLSPNIAAAHAHNEFLQTQISGGVIALMITIAIHLRIGFLLLTCRSISSQETFFAWSVFVCCIVWGLLTPLLSYPLSFPGVLFSWLLLTLEGTRTKNGISVSPT